MAFKQLNNIVGWVVFAIAAIVYILSAEPTGSLWDCGEFIAGAQKLQVVHPPGAPLFLMIGRMFAFIAETIFPDDPTKVAHAVNILSGICTAFVVLFIFWSTTILSKMTLVGRSGELNPTQTIVVLGAGVVAGLSTTFATSVWFSAVEGEVYAMSSFFTAIVIWSTIKWYHLPNNKYSDRWLIFTMYMIGLSIGVHLLSLLTLPALAILYYLKKYPEQSLKGMIAAAAAGAVLFAVIIMTFIMKVIPAIGRSFDKIFVNSFGLPFNSGLLFFSILVVAILAAAIYYTHQRKMAMANTIVMAMTVVVLGFSTYGLIVIRANANTPINMNDPSDAFSLISYLNREQYGDRPLFHGPHFDAKPIGTNSEDKWGRAGDRYEIIDKKLSYKYDKGQMLFVRMGHYDRPAQYRQWLNPENPNSKKRLTQMDNMKFLFKYQIGWMYWRYFMWNFAGRQNGNQGFYEFDKRNGHWQSGIPFLENMRLFNQSKLPDTLKNNQARNSYYLLPFFFGIIGLFFHARSRPKEAFGIFVLFLMTGLAITFYSNQPPNEPRERDYVLVGSFFTFCIWIGMAVVALYRLILDRSSFFGKSDEPLGVIPETGKSKGVAFASLSLVLLAPIIMGIQNWDDHNRSGHTGARDYATNFLESCAPNAIVFTHGDNDTYPLWYAQEVEGIRTDVRVTNLSLLAVDWYIDQLRRKVNDSPPIKMTMPAAAYRGNKRNSLLVNPYKKPDRVNIEQAVKFMSENHVLRGGNGEEMESYIPASNFYIPVDKNKVYSNGTVNPADSLTVLDRVDFTVKKTRLIKDELAILDIIASNQWERPIYFAVTCQPNKILGLGDYLQLEGLALRLMPVKTAQQDKKWGEILVGKGRVATDLMFSNIMNKFKWGNFDKERLYVNTSYMPSVSSLRFSMLRLGDELLKEGKTTKAIQLADKYFEAFPHMNFQFDINTLYMLNIYDGAGAKDKAKPHIKTLAIEMADYMEFYESLSARDKTSFQGDIGKTQQTMQGLMEFTNRPGYEDIKNEIMTMFSPYLGKTPVRPANN